MKTPTLDPDALGCLLDLGRAVQEARDVLDWESEFLHPRLAAVVRDHGMGSRDSLAWYTDQLRRMSWRCGVADPSVFLPQGSPPLPFVEPEPEPEREAPSETWEEDAVAVLAGMAASLEDERARVGWEEDVDLDPDHEAFLRRIGAIPSADAFEEHLAAFRGVADTLGFDPNLFLAAPGRA